MENFNHALIPSDLVLFSSWAKTWRWFKFANRRGLKGLVMIDHTRTFEIVHSANSSSYPHLLQSSEQNPRWVNSSRSTLKPLLIVTPFHESEIQAAMLCTKTHDLQIRVRSGGHDYEGLSYRCKTPFILVDLVNLRSVDIDLKEEAAWVQSGATLGELYYSIAMESKVHGFPAGICPSVGIGGHFSGGGFGTMLRKHGLAADNVIDACLIDVNGRILNRESMAEDLFWAIRGGGGASFGIILSWKIRLVRVPPTVTVFTASRSLEQGATELVHRWQYIAHEVPEDLFIRVIIQDAGDDPNYGGTKTIQAQFNSLFLGKLDSLMPLMNQSFPELGLKVSDCAEMSWIESVLYFAGYKKDDPPELLLDRNILYKSNFKAKSDFVQEPIPEVGLRGIWERFLEEEIVFMIMDPFGGKMNEISQSELPFPHRKGNLYNVQYLVKWFQNGVTASQKHVRWVRMLYNYMTPYVSAAPRAAYLNYRDLDLGNNGKGEESYERASVWGTKYFKDNFRRLAMVKGRVDPENFLRNEQSVPLYPALKKRR
ncbi:FAD-binding PCMH-type domain-containing protein [Psidium guajava]|nr:FAD-binding PCMH-type domain-containing protein [Psidium guajava]